jgi:hypothetical protein
MVVVHRERDERAIAGALKSAPAKPPLISRAP